MTFLKDLFYNWLQLIKVFIDSAWEGEFKFQCRHFEELPCCCSCLGSLAQNINGALWQFALLPCFWWTFSRQWRAKELAMLVTGIIEVVGPVLSVCVWTALSLTDSVLWSVYGEGQRVTFWSINVDENTYFYITFLRHKVHNI